MSSKKLDALIRLIRDEYKDGLGTTMLNKILWSVDAMAYRVNGKSLTGATYIRRLNGPVANHAYTKGATILSDDEQSLVKTVLSEIRKGTAAEVSDITHDVIWKLARNGETIPLCATLASQIGEITDDAMKWANDSVVNMSAHPIPHSTD